MKVPNIKKLVLIGGGGHCKSVLDTVLQMDIFSEIVITDYNVSAGTEILGCKVVGNDDILPSLYADGFINAFITVGSIKSSENRKRICQRARDIGFHFPVIIDPTAVLAKDICIEEGVFIGKNAVINTGAKINEMTIINTGAIIEHDCHIGPFCHVAVGAVVCGGSRLEESVFIGANSTIIQGVKIGSNSVIGAGSVILGDVAENSMVVGISARG